MATIDLLPTIASLTGQQVPQIGSSTGMMSLKSPWEGKRNRYEMLYYEKDGVRQGKWKLVRYKVKADRLPSCMTSRRILNKTIFPNSIRKGEGFEMRPSMPMSRNWKRDSPSWLCGEPKATAAIRKACPLFLNGVATAPARPFVLMFIDDMGYGDIDLWFKDQPDATPGQDGSGGA